MKYFETIVIGSGIAAYRAAGALKAEGKEVALFAENRLSGTSRNTGSDKQTYYKISERGEADNAIEMAKTLSMGGGMGAVLNAANEVAVAAFLGRKIGYIDIYKTIAHTFDTMPLISNPTLDDYAEVNSEARRVAETFIQKF
jgi:pyruvate/2-oxoglutarate dehydrogenase complex dihydrolipoamide dehydrogenase (E3) component